MKTSRSIKYIKCAHKKCENFSRTANSYCCAACANDDYDYKRLQAEEKKAAKPLFSRSLPKPKPSWAKDYMTVAELIEKLKKLPQDALVDLDDQSARGISRVRLVKDKGTQFALLAARMIEW